ncbi:MAG: hypothetical protein OEL89_00195 [Candidatus Peregrinibacteria bacterium]|nr:hypothetical protein [Candidatus Peregrinibacteria bacterium]
MKGYFFQQCMQCGDWFETDAKWKRTCLACFLKKKHPETYSKKYEMKKIRCKECGESFVDEPWKDLCFRCWIALKQEEAFNEREEREQFK